MVSVVAVNYKVFAGNFPPKVLFYITVMVYTEDLTSKVIQV